MKSLKSLLWPFLSLLAVNSFAVDTDVFLTLTRTPVKTESLPTDTEVLTPMDATGFDAQSAGDMVARATSVQARSSGGLGTPITASVRGSSTEQTLILMDGRPYNGFALQSAGLSEIPIEQIDHIEILRGSASALYGPNAMGGVINVISKQGSLTAPTYVDGNYEVGSFGRQAYRGGFGSHQGPVFFSFFGDTQYESGFRDNSDDRQHNLGGNVGVSMGSAGRLSADVSSFHSNSGSAGAITLPWNQFNNSLEKAAFFPSARQITGTEYLRLSYSVDLPKETKLDLHLFGSEREVRYQDFETFPSDSDTHQQTKGVDAQVALPMGFLVGGSFLRDRESKTDRLSFGGDYQDAVENWGLFAQDTFKYGTFTLIPSGRFDHNGLFGWTKNPRVEAMDDVTPYLRVSASGGRSFRAPTLVELDGTYLSGFNMYNFYGNSNLQPETAWTYDAGFELHQSSESFKATLFRSDIRNLIEIVFLGDEADQNTAEQNVAKARRQGLELEAKQVVNAWFDHRVNYTYLDNRGIPTGFSDYTTLPYSPHHTVNYFTTLRPCGGLVVENVFRFVSENFSSAGDRGTKIGSTFLWDLRLNYQLGSVAAYFGIKDLTDKRYEESAGFPLPGRTFYGGLTYHFSLTR